MYIEPCCADRQLPSALKNSKGGFCFFQSGGDVTVQKLMSAVSSMAGSGHRMTLVIPEVDVMLLREIKRYFDRSWTAGLNLLTQTNQLSMLEEELQGYMDRVTYAADPMVIDGLLAFEECRTGDVSTALDMTGKAVIILGAMLKEVDFSFSLYAGYYGSDAEVIDGALKPVRSKLKLRNVGEK